MTIGRMDIIIPGAGPYGFRLAGGDGRPLTVTKLRRQSKACAAGLHEGDYLLGINGFECRTMSHSSAMALLENAVDSISLSVFRGAASQLDSAFDAAASSLRPLSPGSLPPPRLLPPPPAAALSSTGDLVIDQPSFLRQNWPQQKLATAGSDQPAICVCPPAINVAPPPPPAPPMPPRQFAPVTEPRVIDACPPQPLPPSDAVLPTFRVKPFSGEGKQWTPFRQQHAPATPPASFQPQQPASSPGEYASRTLPAKWKPTETPILVRAHAEVNLEPEPEPETVGTTTTWPTPPTMGRVSVRLDRVEGPPNDVEAVPRWALPLRSEYDWRDAYHWGDSDEWEITDDGQYFIRKKKIFADSSFYDEPEHKYPTIEEQIKMARKVAQSLMSPGNVKARGQRMFLRRREKADHWASDIPGPRPGLRRPAAVRAAAVEHFESESELPAPGSVQRSPWHQAEAGAPSWTPKVTDISPTLGAKWRPVHHVEPGRSMPKHGGNVAPQVAFGLAKDLTRMHDKGGRMFATRRARAAAEETEDYASEAVQAARSEVMRRIADSYVPPASTARHEVPDSTVEHPAPSATRLIEMIERSRVTSGGPRATHPASGGRDTTRTITFTTTKTQAGFRPVRFKAPLVVTAADIAVAEQLETEGISDL